MSGCARCGGDKVKPHHTFCPKCRKIERRLWNSPGIISRAFLPDQNDIKHGWRGVGRFI